MKKGIFCLEGMWSSSVEDRSSVRPLLELIEQRGICKHIYQACATKVELNYFLNRWKAKGTQTRYPILYFAFHGEQECICLAGREKVTLDELADQLANSCKGKVFFFASCETIRIDKRKIKSFLQKTGAIAAIGYTEEVDWMMATAFELLVLDALQEDKFDSKGIIKIRDFIKNEYGRLARKLGYRFVINDRVHFPRRRK